MVIALDAVVAAADEDTMLDSIENAKTLSDI
jgi:hypothetical protein